jgi:gamma-glutamyltranspeptidase
MDVLTAVTTPRVHSQLLPNKVDVEAQQLVTGARIDMPTAVFTTLRTLGHANVTAYDGSFAITQFISVDMDTNVRTAVSDPRKDGKPAAQQAPQ